MASMVVVEDDFSILVRLHLCNDRLPREILEEIQAAHEQYMRRSLLHRESA
jgi:hypothetical protein